jgi:protein phosphatase
MGGVDAGGVASTLTVQSIKQSFSKQPADSNTDWNAWMLQAIQQANESVLNEAKKRRIQMGSTLVVAIIHEAVAYLGSVGDSRIYRWNAKREYGRLARLTRDHSVVQGLVDMGQLKDEDRYAHPNRNMILRSIGDLRTGKSDPLPPLRLQAGDWLLLCSDGLWGMVRDQTIHDILVRSSNAQEACDKLVAEANKKGGDDNITAVIAHLPV